MSDGMSAPAIAPRLFHWLTLLTVGAAAAWALWAALHSELGHAAAMTGVAIVGIMLTAPRDRLRPLFRLLLVAATLVNAAGYVLGLWVEATPFDEAVHAFTSFAGTAAIAWFLLSRTSLIGSKRAGPILAWATGIGLAVGIAWELFEWLVGMVGGAGDTAVDLLMDAIGAAAAGLFCAWAASGGRSGPD